MNRKQFIRHGILGGAALSLGATTGLTPAVSDGAEEAVTKGKGDTKKPFTMKFSPDFNVFNQKKETSFEEILEWGYANGFRAWEHTWLFQRTREEQDRIRKALDKYNMEFGQFVWVINMKEVTFAGRDKEVQAQVLKKVEESVEVAKRMRTKYIHNVLGLADTHLPMELQMANAIELLKRCAEIYEKHDLVMVMETMNRWNHPQMFLHNIPQAYALAKGVGSPSVKILFDVYHVQLQEGNILPMLDYVWDEVGYIQIGDTPGRLEPGTGEVNFKNVLAHIHKKGYRGFVGLEHKIEGAGEAGNQIALQRYREVDPVDVVGK